MNFMLISSLEDIALVNVAASLWNQHDVRTLVIEFKNSPLFLQVDENFHWDENAPAKRTEKWWMIEEKVLKKVLQLPIATNLTIKLLGFIQAVGLQILRWMEYHYGYLNFFDFGLPNRFFWTPQGIVDKKKTAELLVKDESINIGTRFRLACIYCLENDICKLWNGLPESTQKFLLNEENIGSSMQTDLRIFWRMYLHGEVARLGSIIRQSLNLKCSAYRYMFRSAADGGNKAAAEYFLQKIVLRKKSLFKTALHVAEARRDCFPLTTDPPQEYYSEVFCFLVSQMSDEQQVKAFEKLSNNVLHCFLDWPWHFFFVNVACRLWNFLSGPNYHALLYRLIHNVRFRSTDYNYQKILTEFWQQSPDSHKRYIMNQTIGDILNLLFEIHDMLSMKLVLQDATFLEKNALIFSDKGRSLCEKSLHQLDLLKFFIQLLISSKDGMIKFKQEYEEYIEREQLETRNPNRTQFLKLLDDLVRVYDKRKNVDEGDCSASKQVCTIGLKEGDT